MPELSSRSRNGSRSSARSDAMQDHPGKLIRVLGDEAHTRKNIEKMLEYENKSGQTTVRPDGCFEIVFQA